jgi:hypothetical protein
MRMILAFKNAGRYDSIITAFHRGDPTVVGCTLDHLQRLVQEEDDCLAVMNINSSSASATSPTSSNPLIHPRISLLPRVLW